MYKPVVNDVPQNRKNDFQSLTTALQSGNLQQAQQAFSSLIQNVPASAQSSSNPTVNDFQAVGTALQAGDISGAQKAFSTLQQDLKTSVKGPHHHHHKDQQTESAPTLSSPDPSNSGLEGVVKTAISTALNLLA
jgi:hypothetical protein